MKKLLRRLSLVLAVTILALSQDPLAASDRSGHPGAQPGMPAQVTEMTRQVAQAMPEAGETRWVSASALPTSAVTPLIQEVVAEGARVWAIASPSFAGYVLESKAGTVASVLALDGSTLKVVAKAPDSELMKLSVTRVSAPAVSSPTFLVELSGLLPNGPTTGNQSLSLTVSPTGPLDGWLDDTIAWAGGRLASIQNKTARTLAGLVVVIGSAVLAAGAIAAAILGGSVAAAIGASLLLLGAVAFWILDVADLGAEVADALNNPPPMPVRPPPNCPLIDLPSPYCPTAIPASIHARATTPVATITLNTYLSIVGGVTVDRHAQVQPGWNDPSKTGFVVNVHEDPDYCVENRPIVNGVDVHVKVTVTDPPKASLQVGEVDPSALATCL